MKCIGIDGESIAPWGYCLLSRSAVSGYPAASLQYCRRLNSKECFEFLLQASHCGEKVRLFGYGIGYDVCHWVADLTDGEKSRLATKGMVYTQQGATVYRLTYRPNAYFTVQRLQGFAKSKVLASATIVDLMRWHRKPFVDVCEEWGTTDIPNCLRAFKANRGIFSQESVSEVSSYCEEECISLSKLGEEMTSRLSGLGIPVSHPFTAGAVAGALMAKAKIQDHWAEPPPDVAGAVSCAFFGGREQCSRYGHFTGWVTQWDIRSAYGWAMTQLPDMNGLWIHCNEPVSKFLHNEGEWSIYKVRWDIDEGKHPVMPFPWRDENGRIHYPPKGTGWHWSPIVRAALKHYPGQSIRIIDAWHYIPSGLDKPYQYVDSLYRARREANEDPVGGLLKSIIVATWGRMCSPGQRPSKTRGQLAWAGMVTALIQERMIDAIHATGENEFISACVDGFWTTSNLPSLPFEAETLGGWTRSNASELLLLRPACYWKRSVQGVHGLAGGMAPAKDNEQGNDDTSWSAHTSGIPGGGDILGDVMEQWRSTGGYRLGKLELSMRRCKGLLACAADGDYSQLGQFSDLPLTVSFNPGMGRMGHECPTMKHGNSWRKWLPYWPPTASPLMESCSFVSRTGLIDDRWKERQEANAIEETSE